MNKVFYIFLIPLFGLSACQGEETAGVERDAVRVITLGATLEQHTGFSVDGDRAATRVAYEATVPDANAPLRAYVWGSTTSGNFPKSDNNGSAGSGYVVERHGYTTFFGMYSALANSGSRGMIFPVNGDQTPDIYFIGLSPAVNADTPENDTWGQTGNSDAYYTFTGKDDVMYAPQVSGHYTGDVPVLHFYHLLTHLRFVLKCEGATQEARNEVSYAWGKIKSLTLTRQNNGADLPCNKVSIDLSKVVTSLQQIATRSTFSNDGTLLLPVYKTGTDNYFPQNPYQPDQEEQRVALPTGEDGEELAYVLCAPVTATSGTAGSPTGEYTLTLETEHRQAVIPIDLMVGRGTYFAGSTMGCEFVVTLLFRFGKVIATAMDVNDWSTQGGQTTADIKDE